ncbi:hypothetical protein A8C32_00760 [Flavivirga aquatica]|uniref:Methyltransferase type 11 domain-containing protein n=1 Tax=Flavivirga aquatica TaxID=1849968 RepID=A0A1E5TC17_9FLAO|nr:hypothetical protein [Flavivirga aquatica]OEK08911.1 hypothetical protein A8C32_00760 [Flavivirga aquatica]
MRTELKNKRKINVGSGNLAFNNDWFSCDIEILDITKKTDWYLLLGYYKVSNIFAEHVWEHLDDKDTDIANKNCYRFLKKNGRLRIAVPDGYHPSKDYIDYVKPNGTGLGADDHKILYNYSIMKEKLEKIGFKVKLLEYWDEHGVFHHEDWKDKHGKVMRSKRYDLRNADGSLSYTSLIVDAIK